MSIIDTLITNPPPAARARRRCRLASASMIRILVERPKDPPAASILRLRESPTSDVGPASLFAAVRRHEIAAGPPAATWQPATDQPTAEGLLRSLRLGETASTTHVAVAVRLARSALTRQLRQAEEVEPKQEYRGTAAAGRPRAQASPWPLEVPRALVARLARRIATSSTRHNPHASIESVMHLIDDHGLSYHFDADRLRREFEEALGQVRWENQFGSGVLGPVGITPFEVAAILQQPTSTTSQGAAALDLQDLDDHITAQVHFILAHTARISPFG